MADEKLTGLPTIASADDADLLYVVDVSDTTDDPAGSSKAISFADLTAGLGGGGGGLIEIESITDPVSGDFDFTNIPQTYKRLVIKGDLDESNDAQLYVELNNDNTAANYDGQFLFLSTTLARGAEPNSNRVGLMEATPAFPSNFHMKIPAYTRSDTNQLLRTETCYDSKNAQAVHSIEFFTRWSTSAAITSLKIRSGGTISAGTLTLYGEN